MTDMTDEAVKALLDGATPGRRVQFHGSYCPEAVGTPFTDWDTSHDVSVIRPDGSRYRLAHYKHASDAYLSQMAPDLARALLDTRAKLADWIVRADEANVKVETLEAELARVRADAVAALAAKGLRPDAAEILAKEMQMIVAADRWKGRDLHSAPPEKWHKLRPETQQFWIDTATRILAALEATPEALAQTPTDPGDGWTWNERLGWIGPDGKPAARGGA